MEKEEIGILLPKKEGSTNITKSELKYLLLFYGVVLVLVERKKITRKNNVGELREKERKKEREREREREREFLCERLLKKKIPAPKNTRK